MINCTPHPISIRMPDGTLRTYPPSGVVARVTTEETVACHLHGVVPVVRRTMGMVQGLPREADGSIMPCLVSSMVLAALPAGTKNVYAPDTGATAIRDTAGQVIAVNRLVMP